MKNRGLAQNYTDIIRQQLEAGIIEKVSPMERDKECSFYLPHHGIIRTDKETTKLHVVFDGSVKELNQCSLNECLEKGPNLIPHIFNILLRFRTYLVGIIADIEKAFHQILVYKDDRDMLEFLWLEDVWSDHSVVHYRFCWLVFGLTPSPAILNTVIHRYLAECGSR